MRASPNHKSEMVSQLLFGECMEVLEQQPDGWIRVKCQYDAYEGWSTLSHISFVEEEIYRYPDHFYAGDWVNEISLNGQSMYVPFGAAFKELRAGYACWGATEVVYEGALLDIGKNKVSKKFIKDIAFTFLNTPYLWGGKSVFGIDCSGFSQSVYKLAGIPLLRDACQQAAQGETVGFLQEAGFGDLAFFDNEEGRIIHVGILLDSHTIIHAAGKVRVDRIDRHGILNMDTGHRTHRLRIIKRIIHWGNDLQ